MSVTITPCCPGCHKKTGEPIRLEGKLAVVMGCPKCNEKIIGGVSFGGCCPKCSHMRDMDSKDVWPIFGSYKDGDSIPDEHACPTCDEKVKGMLAEVERGGVFFLCHECGASGVIKAEAQASKAAREHAKLPAPAPLTLGFEHCGQHNPSEQ